jgi:protein-S-isoprenylcysteine O-methyltransferase Ste14
MVRKLGALVLQFAPFLGLLLAGWGFEDWRGFFIQPARAALLGVTACGALSILILKLDPHPIRRGNSPLGHQSLVLLILALASLFLIWFLPFADRRGILRLSPNEDLRYCGLLLFAVAITIRLMALQQLGRYFSAYVTLQDEHRLIQSGIYGVIRHPLYLSLLLAAPGFALVFSSALLAPILALTVLFVSLRISQEERLLKLQFGQSFSEYRRRTWALIPLLL